MATNPSRIFFTPGQDITCKATTAVIGCRFVSLSTNGTKPTPNIKPSVVSVKPFGVAAEDAGIGEHTVVRKGGVVGVYAGAALSAGQEVEATAVGKAIVLAAGVPAGRVLFDAAIDTIAQVEIYI